MTKTLYLMRHGETLFNVLRKLQGWSDSALTERGIAQAQITARDFFAQLDEHPDVFVTSSAERACDTLEIVCEQAWGFVPAYQRTKGLKDLNLGSYEAKDRFLVGHPPYGSFFVKFGGESQQHLQQRMIATLTSIMDEAEGNSVLAVSHAMACAEFQKAWDELNLVPYRAHTKPGSVFVYDFDEDARTFCCTKVFEPDLSTLED